MRMPRGKVAPDVLEARRRAMGKLKAALDGRPQTWLVQELGKRGFATSKQNVSHYFNGYVRISRAMLDAACVLACGNNGHMGEMLRDGILASIGDEALLIQGMTPARK